MPDNEKLVEPIKEAIMSLLEAKFTTLVGAIEETDAPPVNQAMLRAAFFSGVSAGMDAANTIIEPVAELVRSSTDEG